jgi:hypothetical protein
MPPLDHRRAGLDLIRVLARWLPSEAGYRADLQLDGSPALPARPSQRNNSRRSVLVVQNQACAPRPHDLCA